MLSSLPGRAGLMQILMILGYLGVDIVGVGLVLKQFLETRADKSYSDET